MSTVPEIAAQQAGASCAQPRRAVIDRAWRALGPGVEVLSGDDGGPLSRTVKRILDPLVLRLRSNPHYSTPVVSGDTAGAAREVAEAGDRTQAAISPPMAAQIYGLEIVRDEVEDEDHNTTRFVVLSGDFTQADRTAGPIVTTFIFNVRNLPSALYKALGGFATNGVNMTKLESYMVGGHFAATQFLAEIDGHPDDPGVKNALEELAFFTTEVKVLGVYRADAFRSQ